jgi:hypothetical protein
MNGQPYPVQSGARNTTGGLKLSNILSKVERPQNCISSTYSQKKGASPIESGRFLGMYARPWLSESHDEW